MDTNDALIEKIKKLLTLAQSGNEHEAAAAMAAAQRLMVKNEIDMATIESPKVDTVVDHVLQERSDVARACTWKASLATAIGREMGVKVVYTSGTTLIRSFGRATDVALHAALYNWVLRQLVADCDRAWYRQRVGRTGTKVSFTHTFMLYAEREIATRMRSARTVEIDAAKLNAGGGALVLVNSLAKRQAETERAVNAYIGTAIGRVGTTSRTVKLNDGAASAGRAAGQAANLKPNQRTLTGR